MNVDAQHRPEHDVKLFKSLKGGMYMIILIAILLVLIITLTVLITLAVTQRTKVTITIDGEVTFEPESK